MLFFCESYSKHQRIEEEFTIFAAIRILRIALLRIELFHCTILHFSTLRSEWLPATEWSNNNVLIIFLIFAQVRCIIHAHPSRLPGIVDLDLASTAGVQGIIACSLGEIFAEVMDEEVVENRGMRDYDGYLVIVFIQDLLPRGQHPAAQVAERFAADRSDKNKLKAV